MFCSVNYAWRVVRGRCIYKGRIAGGGGAIYARSAATARYLGALRGDGAPLEPSHRRDEQKVPDRGLYIQGYRFNDDNGRRFDGRRRERE